MTLEDFERQLADEKKTAVESRKQSDEKHREEADRPRHRHHHHHHQHRHRRHHDSHHRRRSPDTRGQDQISDEHRTKRRRRSRDDDRDNDGSKHKSQRSQRDHRMAPPTTLDNDMTLDVQDAARPGIEQLKRDSWMEAPSALKIDYIQPRRKQSSPPPPPKGGSLSADYELKIHKNELNHHLRDITLDQPHGEIEREPVQHDIDYTIGDAGSMARMTKLRAVRRLAQESGRSVEQIALERYETLRDFDDAREEEIELERRNTYGKDYVGKQKPNGDLFQERKLQAGIHKVPVDRSNTRSDVSQILEGVIAPSTNDSGPPTRVDQTTLNKLKASLMKAKLRKDPDLSRLQEEYDQAVAASSSLDPTVVTLSAMDNRMLSSAPRAEVRAVQNRRGAERGNVEENEDMSIDDMVREEKRTRGQAGGEAKRFAERIAKDGKFDNDLEYMDENANKLAKRVHQSDGNLRNIAINDYQKLNKILESCPLCHHEDNGTPPIAPIVSLATRTYLTLPTEPTLAAHGAIIVPVEHHTNLLECDDDEWEEIRNFMKSLTRLYHDQGRDVIFYENAAHPHRKPHAALNVVPLPYSLGETAPAFFKEAFLTTEDEWSQHKKIIDTLAKSKQGLGKLAFRRSLVREMPYFHVWFEMDGGLGHVVEDAQRWPKGDLFAREIVGGMLGLEPDVIKRQGRWHRGHDARVEAFRKIWRKFDWTRVLTEG